MVLRGEHLYISEKEVRVSREDVRLFMTPLERQQSHQKPAFPWVQLRCDHQHPAAFQLCDVLIWASRGRCRLQRCRINIDLLAPGS